MMDRKLVAQIGIFLSGCVLGSMVAYSIERALHIREARYQLADFASRLVQRGDKLGQEDLAAMDAVNHDNLPFCSDQEIAFMRDYVFRSTHIRDIGRTKNAWLYCSAGIGRVSVLTAPPRPDIDYNGLKIFLHVPLLISHRTIGFIVEKDDVSVVLSPNNTENFNEPPMSYAAMLKDPPNHRIIRTSGPAIPLTDAEILAGRMIERNGVVYKPLCSQTSLVCRVAIEPRAAMMSTRPPLFFGFVVAGAFLGGTLAMILILLYRGHRSLERQLQRALRNGSLTLVYQPVVSLETKRIVGAEALVRWINEDGESVRPDVFVALAEQRGFVGEITRLVARRMVDELGDLLATKSFRVTLNITSRDVADPDFSNFLKTCLEAAKVDPPNVGLELTERSTADHRSVAAGLAKLRSAGHMIYIDDFGTGYSSLAYLHELHIDAIKIDRSFTKTVGTGAVTASVVPQILEMAAQLDLLVVVEGIETNQQAEYFRAAGRDILGQGWLFGKPVPAAQFRKLTEA
jgi:sensor c-di-GMP phosphodiesterase-like protein